jgi:hypothetical protein
VHAYSVYGLGLHSEFPIPELLESGSAAADIVVRRASVPVVSTSRPPASAQPSEPDDSWAERRAQGAETLCVFAGVGRYLVRGGQLVLVDPEPDVDFAAVRHLLLGPVLAHLLWQRDVFALHASVVGVRGRHLAFLGVSGEGKSTIAAALEAAGHVLVCDDVAGLVQREKCVEVLPGFPRIRLHADSLRSIGDDPGQHPFVHDQIEKRLKRVGSFATGAVVLDAIYVLATTVVPALERLPPGASVVEILRHTYYAHQFAPLYGFQHHLQRATRIAELVPSFRLGRPKDLALLPELVGFIEAHASA